MDKRKRVVNQFDQQQRFYKVHSQKIRKEVLEYLKDRFQNLKIEICGEHEGNIIELMNKGLLEGWCWQTTETSIIFLNDEDSIERGILKLNPDRNYHHSWICFWYQNVEYVFDPCLDILCTKDLYHQVFDIKVMGKVNAKEVRDYLINCIEIPKKREYKLSKKSEEFINHFLAKYGNDKLEETYISGDNNINSPMYRNHTGYQADIENGKVKKLTAHYYLGG